MDKQETSLEIQDLVDFNREELGNMQNKSPEIYNAFKNVLELLDKKYGSGSFELKTPTPTPTPQMSNLIPLKSIVIKKFDTSIDRDVTTILTNWESANKELVDFYEDNYRRSFKCTIKVEFADGTLYQSANFQIGKKGFDVSIENLNFYFQRLFKNGGFNVYTATFSDSLYKKYDWGDANDVQQTSSKIQLARIEIKKIGGEYTFSTWDDATEYLKMELSKVKPKKDAEFGCHMYIEFDNGTKYENRTFVVNKTGGYDPSLKKFGEYMKGLYYAFEKKDGKDLREKEIDKYDWIGAKYVQQTSNKIKLKRIKIDLDSFTDWNDANNFILKQFSKAKTLTTDKNKVTLYVKLEIEFLDGTTYDFVSFRISNDKGFNPDVEKFGSYMMSLSGAFRKSNGNNLKKEEIDNYDWGLEEEKTTTLKRGKTIVPVMSIIIDSNNYTWETANDYFESRYNGSVFNVGLTITWEDNVFYNLDKFVVGNTFNPRSQKFNDYAKTLSLRNNSGQYLPNEENKNYDFGDNVGKKEQSKAVKLPSVPLNEIWSEDWIERKLPKTPARKPKEENEIGLGNDGFIYVADSKLKWKKKGKQTFESDELFNDTYKIGGVYVEFTNNGSYFDMFFDLADEYQVFQPIDLNNASLRLANYIEDGDIMDLDEDIIQDWMDKKEQIDQLIKDKYQSK